MHNEGLIEETELTKDYVKFIVLNYQHKFPDTELSKKLGISRKSLWERRKKYGIIKNDYIILKGSIPGPSKRLIFMTPSKRKSRTKDAFEVIQ